MNCSKGLRLGFALVAGFMATSLGAKEVVGWVEHVQLYPGGIHVRAKMDSGAKTSSLHCECITPVKRGDQDWVSFTVRNADGDVIRLEKPVLRVAKIKRHFGESQQRYVIRLGICMGEVYREEEVTLVDRSGFNYPMLIGRNFLKGDFLIDPDKTFTLKGGCKVPPAK